MSDAISPPPTWTTSDRGLIGSAGRLAGKLVSFLERWIVCRGNKVAYLRRLGARIGSGSAILNRVEDFGTEPWLVEIGARVTVASGVVFVTHDGASRVFRHQIAGASAFGNCFGTIRILDNSFVGLRSVLMPGVVVGPNSVVGAGSVVIDDVPPDTVAAGVPARALCTLGDYLAKYRARMIPGLSSDRRQLRRQLTRKLWGEER